MYIMRLATDDHITSHERISHKRKLEKAHEDLRNNRSYDKADSIGDK
jgi:hypothetical protein